MKDIYTSPLIEVHIPLPYNTDISGIPTPDEDVNS